MLRLESSSVCDVYETMASPVHSSPSISPTRMLSHDVIEIITPIKHELMHLQSRFGEDSVFGLTPCIMLAMEELHKYKSLYDIEVQRATEQADVIERLQKDITRKSKEKKDLHDELAELEQSYNEERDKAIDSIEKLTEENKELRQRLKSVREMENDVQYQKSEKDEDESSLVHNLRERITKERERSKELEERLSIEESFVLNLQNNLEKLYNQNHELLRKNRKLFQQGRTLSRAKEEMKIKLQSAVDDNISTHHALQDLIQKSSDHDVEQFHNSLACQDQPRYTENELSEVLASKVKLVERISELESELESFKSGNADAFDRLDDFMSPSPSTSSLPTPVELLPPSNGTEECIVYGPINREPFEKLYPQASKKEGAISKFFTGLFKTNSPKRSPVKR